jgi:hypothetical protein
MSKHPPIKLAVVCLILAFASTARADIVSNWNTAALNAIRASRTAPPVASRALAMLQVAIYDAVIGIVRSHEPYAVPSAVPASASLEAAASAAAHRVLTTVFPGHAATFAELHALALAAIPDTPHKKSGVAWGEAVADQILAARSHDNADAIMAAPPGTGVGTWEPTPPASTAYVLPQWGFVVQVIVIPYFIGSEDAASRRTSRVLSFLKRRSLVPLVCDPGIVSDQIAAYLEHARAAREVHEAGGSGPALREAPAPVSPARMKREIALIRRRPVEDVNPLSTDRGPGTYLLGRGHANDRRRARRRSAAELPWLWSVELPSGTGRESRGHLARRRAPRDEFQIHEGQYR